MQHQKLEEALRVSEEILSDLESELPLESVLAKCKKLARLRNDFSALEWFTLELHGYNEKDLPSGVKPEALDAHAKRAGRMSLVFDAAEKKEVQKYWIASVPEIEAGIKTNLISLDNLKPPEQFTPAISKHAYESMYTGQTSSEHVVEKYQDVLLAMSKQRSSLQNAFTHNKTLLSKIKNNIYNFVLDINLQLKFENTTESVFQETKQAVDSKLTIIAPDAIKKFLAAYDRLKSKNPEEWSQALSSCRNILKEFADYVYPSRKEEILLSDGKKLSVTEDKYKNRLLAFIDQKFTGNKRRLLESRVGDLCGRIRDLNDLLSQGAKNEMNFIDVNMCVLETYLVVGSLINLVEFNT